MPLAFNPHIWQQYADALGNRPPSQWVSPTIGTLLRLAFGEELFRLQFVPLAIGLAWFAWHWRKHGREWDWREQLPLLLLVSFVTAPYGAWPFDMVLLLPAAMWLVLHAKPPARGPVVAGLVAVNVGCLAMNLLKISSFWFLWVSPAVLLLYIAGTRTRTSVANAAVRRCPARGGVAGMSTTQLDRPRHPCRRSRLTSSRHDAPAVDRAGGRRVLR